MTLRRTIFLFAALAASTGLSLAGEAAAQVATQETYQLAQVAGQQLPVVTEESGDCRDELHAATLTLGTDGRWTLVTTEQEICPQETEEEEDTEEGTYTLEGETIRFMDSDGETPVDDGDDTELEVDDLVQGTRTGEGLTVRVADGETELVFRR
jgi:hypothetical protein